MTLPSDSDSSSAPNPPTPPTAPSNGVSSAHPSNSAAPLSAISAAGPQTFAYSAQSLEGQPFTGTIDAADAEDAARRLTALKLRVLELTPVRRPPRARSLTPDEFFAFNQQLAQLTSAGLPVEFGLRLIAQDMSRGRAADTL